MIFFESRFFIFFWKESEEKVKSDPSAASALEPVQETNVIRRTTSLDFYREPKSLGCGAKGYR